ncbi:MAG: DUF2974 domain-containing protein [Deltaproteobacteria bacterium]|nr:DUF2974 domain-containing protein [Deltaproteobacteria bacterium]
MNKLKMFDVAYVWPYCALAARYDEDSGDGDNEFSDFIDDLVEKWLPGSTVHKYFEKEKIDFTYAIEHGGKLLICFLGTEGAFSGPGWKSDFSPQIESPEYRELGGHVDFIRAGIDAAYYFYDLVREYGGNYMVAGHSRGGPRCMSAAREWYRLTSTLPGRIVPFCSPPVFNAAAATEYDNCGLGSVTIRPTMSYDPVDLLGWPILRHVGTELKLPRIKTKAIRRRGLLGKIVFGHAYSSVFECLKRYCQNRAMTREIKWLKDTEWVAEI